MCFSTPTFPLTHKLPHHHVSKPQDLSFFTLALYLISPHVRFPPLRFHSTITLTKVLERRHNFAAGKERSGFGRCHVTPPSELRSHLSPLNDLSQTFFPQIRRFNIRRNRPQQRQVEAEAHSNSKRAASQRARR